MQVKNILSDRNLSGKNIKVFVFNVSYHPTGKTNIPKKNDNCKKREKIFSLQKVLKFLPEIFLILKFRKDNYKLNC